MDISHILEDTFLMAAVCLISETEHSNYNNSHVHPAKSHISMCICAVLSESSSYVLWLAKDPNFDTASENSDQTVRMRRLSCLHWVLQELLCPSSFIALNIFKLFIPKERKSKENVVRIIMSTLQHLNYCCLYFYRHCEHLTNIQAKDPKHLHTASEDWSDCADAHADLGLR